MNALEDLVFAFSKLPGIGKKSASRIAFHILKMDAHFSENLARKILELKDKIKFCSVCGAYTEEDPCPICTNPSRDTSLLCILERPEDVMTIEASHEYSGLYHVLGGVISPLDGIGPEKLRIAELLGRLKNGGIKEVIIATNPTVEGDTTAMFIQRILQEKGVRVSRLATGIPVGGDLEYADRLTLARSFRGRFTL